MSEHRGAGSALDGVLGRTRHLLFDFDGPICAIFAGVSAATIAAQLRKTLHSQGVEIPESVATTDDPFDVLRFAATLGQDLAARAEAAMTEQELSAVPTAAAAAYLHEAITACRNSGRSVAVISNNSLRAVTTYLTTHGLDRDIDLVVGRTDPDASLLKPNPHLIHEAMSRLDADPMTCAIVGDSTDNIEAARAAEVASIGYANKPGKYDLLTAAGADATIGSLAELALRLRAHPVRPAP